MALKKPMSSRVMNGSSTVWWDRAEHKATRVVVDDQPARVRLRRAQQLRRHGAARPVGDAQRLDGKPLGQGHSRVAGIKPRTQLRGGGLWWRWVLCGYLQDGLKLLCGHVWPLRSEVGGGETAIHRQVDAAHPACRVAAQEGDHRRHFVTERR